MWHRRLRKTRNYIVLATQCLEILFKRNQRIWFCPKLFGCQLRRTSLYSSLGRGKSSLLGSNRDNPDKQSERSFVLIGILCSSFDKTNKFVDLKFRYPLPYLAILHHIMPESIIACTLSSGVIPFNFFPIGNFFSAN